MFFACIGFKTPAETSTSFPPIINMSYTILNSSYLSIDTVIGKNMTISGGRWHFNLIVYDEAQIQTVFKIIYLRTNFTDDSGGSVPLP